MSKRVFATLLIAMLVAPPPAIAQTRDGDTPSEETVCDGLEGAAFGLCNAYCEAQDCDVNPSRNSCEQLRNNFERQTGTRIFPCDRVSPTATNTGTSTRTRTPTNTAAATATNTATNTPTNTAAAATASPTFTVSTATPTGTATETAPANTDTPTFTATATETASPTITVSTATPTGTATETAPANTDTPTFTATATETASPTVTVGTASPTGTATEGPPPATMTATATFTPTVTVTVGTSTAGGIAEEGSPYGHFKARARLSGDNEVPSVDTDAKGLALFGVGKFHQQLGFKLFVTRIEDIIFAHIHCGPVGVNGPVVAFLFGPEPGGVTVRGLLARGTISDDDVIAVPDSMACPGGIADLDDLIAKIKSGETYVNVHTLANQGGEIRGQIGRKPNGD